MAHAENAHHRFTQQQGRPGTSRKDLFNLSAPDAAIRASHHLQAIQSLTREGILVIPAGDNHWILRGSRALPEVHCYSMRELQRFARSTARHYLTNTDRETS